MFKNAVEWPAQLCQNEDKDIQVLLDPSSFSLSNLWYLLNEMDLLLLKQNKTKQN